MELQAQAVVAIGGVVTALIAGAFSFVNLTLNKEQKTSEFRQAWIDGLREDLSTFFAGARAMARATEERRHKLATGGSEASFAMTEEKVADIRYAAAETRYRIQLRLNLKEQEHKELLRLMNVAIEEQNKFFTGTGDVKTTLKAIDNAADYAPQILKAEWERVKQGELPFRLARNWVAPSVIVLSLLFIALVLTGTIKV
jgi:hypothetical protein